MKKIALLFILLMAISCKSQNKENQTEEGSVTEQSGEATTDSDSETEEEELPILLGKLSTDVIQAEPYASAWYNENYEWHPLDKATIAAVKPLLKDVKIKLFMGTWCEDSQMQVPAFFKIIEEAGYNKESITFTFTSTFT